MTDSKKDVLQGGAAVALALAATTSPLAVAAAAIPTLLGLGWDKIASSSHRRAERLYQHMLDANDDPTEFAERLRSDKEDVLVALRALIVASVDAISPAAIEPIALIGRAYLRQECPAFAARGWLRILSVLTEAEIGELREFVHVAFEACSEYRARLVSIDREVVDPQVEIRLDRNRNYVTFEPLNIPNAIFQREGEPPRHVVGEFVKTFAIRLWTELLSNHLAFTVFDFEMERRKDREAARPSRSAVIPTRDDTAVAVFAPEALKLAALAFRT